MPDPSVNEPWLPTQAGGIRASVAWRDGDTSCIASGGEDGTVRVWDAETGAMIGSPLTGHSDAVQALACWSGQDKIFLASAGSDAKICIWDPLIDTPIMQINSGHSGSIMSLAQWMSPNGNRLATGSYDGTIRIWDEETGLQVGNPLIGHSGPVVGLICWRSQEGNFRLASASDDASVRVWNPEDQSSISGPLLVHSSTVEVLTYWQNDDGSISLMLGGQDGKLSMWDPETGIMTREPFKVSTGGVWSLCCLTNTNGSRWIAAGDVNGVINFWDPKTGKRAAEPLSGSDRPLRTLQPWSTPSGPPLLIASGVDGYIRIWDLSVHALCREIVTGHVAAVWGLTHYEDPDGSARLGFVGSDGRLHVCDPQRGAIVGESSKVHGPGIWAVTSWIAENGNPRILSGSLDGTLQVWDAVDCAPVGAPFAGHSASVSALTWWRTEDGHVRVASCGDDAAIYIWDPESQSRVGDPIHGHEGGLLALTNWKDDIGRTNLASAGADGEIRIWDANSGIQLRTILHGMKNIWALCCWRMPYGGMRLASSGVDGAIRLWDPSRGVQAGAPLTGHAGPVRALASWRASNGSVRLASAGVDGIRIWDPDGGVPIGKPMIGQRGVRALTVWRDPDGSVRLASAGDDGTVRLWDPERGLSVRTIEIGTVNIWGMSDSPATIDLLGRSALADAIVGQLRPERNSSNPDSPGPAVVTIEGSWGCGKTTLMDLVRQGLARNYGPSPIRTTGGTDQLTVRQAMRSLRRAPNLNSGKDNHDPSPKQGIVTAWFNPWSHQSGEQIWAGLTDAIMEAVEPVLYPTESQRERYWLTLNHGRVDRHALRRSLRRQVLSPLLGVALVTVVLPLTLGLLQLNKSWKLIGYPVNATVLAFVLPATFLITGSLHTLIRYWHGRAASYLPGSILKGPISEWTKFGSEDASTATADPLRRATRGALYLQQHDVKIILGDIADKGYTMIIFIDDLDRCAAATTAEVFEAINLFLSTINSNRLFARFVIGIDTSVVAAHLDQLYTSLNLPHVARQGEDPSAGWTYLRKLVQLPVVVPHVSNQGIDDFIDTAIGGLVGQGPTVKSPGVGVVAHASRGASTEPLNVGISIHAISQTAADIAKLQPIQADESGDIAVEVIPWRSLERHPQVRDFMRERLSAQPDRSVREAKRLINVWQLYMRVLEKLYPLPSPSQELARARTVVLLAEIITRWPSLRRSIFQFSNEQIALQRLAKAAKDSYYEWGRVVHDLGIDPGYHNHSLENLRVLLQEYDGEAVAQLAQLLV